jgi:hypothetical protein
MRLLAIKAHQSREASDLLGVPLDKSEGSVKGKVLLGGAGAPFFCQRGLRTKTLEHRAAITFRWKIVPPTIDSV